MDSILSKLNTTPECDSECREYKKRIELKTAMNKNKLLVSRHAKKYNSAKNDYYNRIYGTNWSKNKSIMVQNSTLKTKYDAELKKYDREFQSLAKYYIDSLFLLKNQKTVISKNRDFSENHKKQIEKQKELMGSLDFIISTTNRKINFSHNERANTGTTLRIMKYIFYILSTIVIIGVGFILFIEIKQKYNTGKNEPGSNLQKILRFAKMPVANANANVSKRIKYGRQPVA